MYNVGNPYFFFPHRVLGCTLKQEMSEHLSKYLKYIECLVFVLEILNFQ